ncbi:MAG: 2OG-Fe(II) oxygenase family protein [Deltaproteobacteria bacterium]|jgi:isopenicillin N synthase-like dioxygenase
MLPVVDLSDADAAERIGEACRRFGFFYVRSDIDAGLLTELDAVARAFFARPVEEKMAIAMAKGGRAWRGYFPLHGELTSGVPDEKEGLYFGAEREADGRRLVGPNLFASETMRDVVLAYVDAMTKLGHRLTANIAASLSLPRDYFRARYTDDPLILFRIFHYPPLPRPNAWSVGAHADYGLLTILLQDDVGGLEVKGPDGWIAAPPIPGTFVVNLGDMLDRLTGGLYRSTLHRVQNPSSRSRLSFPFFFDPSLDAVIEPLPGTAVLDDEHTRWDQESVRAFEGTYGDYLVRKIGRVFPDLDEAVRAASTTAE